MEPFIISVFMALLLFGGYYAFVVQPRQRAFKRQYKVVSSMKVGEEVVTFGGLVGTVKRIDAEAGLVMLEIAPGVEVRVLAMGINQLFDSESIADNVERVSRSPR